MALDSPKLHTVLELIKTGAMQLPDFQRDWKWDDLRIRELIATITLDYPLGVVMTMETGGKSPFRARPLIGSAAEEGTDPDLLLLDGQQRLTSLSQALFMPAPVQTRDVRGNDLACWYYIDVKKAIHAPSDRDEAIVAVTPEKVWRTKFPRPIEIHLPDTESECRAGLFPLNIVFDIDRVHAWQRTYVKLDDANWSSWTSFEGSVLQHIRSYLIPMIKLDATTTPDAVCAVFERVNTGGVPLNVFELLTASYAGDRDYESEHGDYYRLPETWREIKKELATAYPVFERQDNGTEGGLSNTDFLQAVTLVHTWERKQAGLAASVSAKRRDLLSLPLLDFDRLAPRLRDAFAWVGDFLTTQCIVRNADLPYQTQLLPLAALRAILGEDLDGEAVMEKITRWYWCGVLGEMYSGSTESRIPRDLEQLIDWTRGDGSSPDTVTEAVFLEDRLDTLSTRNSAAYKGIYALLAKQGAVDWYYNQSSLHPTTLVQYAVDIRQVFPKTWCAKNGIPSSRANSIVNKTPLSLRASRSVVGAPSSYLPLLASESGTRDEWFDDVVATHLMSPTALRADDFEAFYADRAKQLITLVGSAMGKGTLFREPEQR
ncbi:GmrSD restriction endonuclease domain-containing protein [Nocardia tengchongensis]|uniref:GmrSD restriction endonuclease domain-containing protein n=1 Tax=Nocardia tengchongensis TaxID=2055889 RepID=UPI003614CE59